MAVTLLTPTIPYDFHRSAMIFSGGDPQIRIYNKGIFRQVLDIAGTLVLAEVFSRGTVDAPELCLTLHSRDALSKRMRTKAADLIASIFNINEDMAPFCLAMQHDPIMSSLIRQLRGVRSPTTPTIFEALIDSVIEQQISLKAAHSIERRLIRAVGSTLAVHDLVYYSYPIPVILAETTDSTFRACGLTRRKGEYIRGISQDILSGTLDLEGFRKYSDTGAIINELMKIRGVGQWTAELTILRGLHRPDAFPADDIGVRRLIAQFYLHDTMISSTEARNFAVRWGSWKGFAVYYLVVADLLGISYPESPGAP
jgi:DNA-3-methyladenine glycosylase II